MAISRITTVPKKKKKGQAVAAFSARNIWGDSVPRGVFFHTMPKRGLKWIFIIHIVLVGKKHTKLMHIFWGIT